MAAAMPKPLFEPETYRFIYTCRNYAVSQLCIEFQCQITSINGAIIFLDVGNIKCYKLHLKCCCPFTFFPFYINAGLPMVRKHKNMVKQTTGSSQKSNYSNIRTFYYYDFKLFWASKLLLI